MDKRVCLFTPNRKVEEFLVPFFAAHDVDVTVPSPDAGPINPFSLLVDFDLILAIDADKEADLLDLVDSSEESSILLRLRALPETEIGHSGYRFHSGKKTLSAGELLDMVLGGDGKSVLEAVSTVPARLSQLLSQVILLFGSDLLKSREIDAGRFLAVQHYSTELGKTLGLNAQELENLSLASLFYDLGMLMVPSDILNKNAPLSEEDRQHLARHPDHGSTVARNLGLKGRILEIIGSHHEQVNGKGYPDQRAGNEIPVEARILAVVDAYTAMLFKRPYRPARSRTEALMELIKNSGTVYDEKIVKAFGQTIAREEKTGVSTGDVVTQASPLISSLQEAIFSCFKQSDPERAGNTEDSSGRNASDRSNLSGSLCQIRLDALCQMLHHGFKTARIVIHSNEGMAEVFIKNGEVIHATFDARIGEEAFYEALLLNEGQFDIEFGIKSPEESIVLTLEHLLLEGFRRLDDSRRNMKDSPATT